MNRKLYITLFALIVFAVFIACLIYYMTQEKKLITENFLQFSNDEIKTVQTPDQTHNILIENLKKKDFKQAVECCFFSIEFKKRREFFESVQQRGMLNMMINDLMVIKKESLTDSVATYSYLGSKQNSKVSNLIIFNKDEKGVWRIKSL